MTALPPLTSSSRWKSGTHSPAPPAASRAFSAASRAFSASSSRICRPGLGVVRIAITRAGRGTDQDAQEEGGPVALLAALPDAGADGGVLHQLASRRNGGTRRRNGHLPLLPELAQLRAQVVLPRAAAPAHGVTARVTRGLLGLAALRRRLLPCLFGTLRDGIAGLADRLRDLSAALRRSGRPYPPRAASQPSSEPLSTARRPCRPPWLIGRDRVQGVCHRQAGARAGRLLDGGSGCRPAASATCPITARGAWVASMTGGGSPRTLSTAYRASSRRPPILGRDDDGGTERRDSRAWGSRTPGPPPCARRSRAACGGRCWCTAPPAPARARSPTTCWPSSSARPTIRPSGRAMPAAAAATPGHAPIPTW